MKNRFYWIATAAALSLGFVPALHATAIYTTLGPGGSFDMSTFVEMGTSALVPGAYADEFTSPVNATVGSVSLALSGQLAIPAAQLPVPFTISINTLTGPGGPTNIVGTFNPGNVTQLGLYTFASTTAFQLNAGTEYWLTVSDANPLGWFASDQGVDNVTASRSPFGVWTLNGSGTALAFELDTVPEPGNATLYAMALVATCLWRKRTASSRK